MDMSTDVQRNEVTLAILRESLDSAADRVIAKRGPKRSGRKGCPHCGGAKITLSAGHIYCLIGMSFFVIVALIGVIQK